MIFEKEIFCIENNVGVPGEIFTLKNTVNSNIKVENSYYNDNIKRRWNYFLINVLFTMVIVGLELIWPILVIVDDFKHRNEDVFGGMTGSEVMVFLHIPILILIIFELAYVIIKSIFYINRYKTFYRIVEHRTKIE